MKIKASLTKCCVIILILTLSFGTWGTVGVPEAKAAVDDTHKQWMWDHRDWLEDIPLTRLIIPGSHDSFTSTLNPNKGTRPIY